MPPRLPITRSELDITTYVQASTTYVQASSPVYIALAVGRVYPKKVHHECLSKELKVTLHWLLVSYENAFKSFYINSKAKNFSYKDKYKHVRRWKIKKDQFQLHSKSFSFKPLCINILLLRHWSINIKAVCVVICSLVATSLGIDLHICIGSGF